MVETGILKAAPVDWDAWEQEPWFYAMSEDWERALNSKTSTDPESKLRRKKWDDKRSRNANDAKLAAPFLVKALRNAVNHPFLDGNGVIRQFCKDSGIAPKLLDVFLKRLYAALK